MHHVEKCLILIPVKLLLRMIILVCIDNLYDTHNPDQLYAYGK